MDDSSRDIKLSHYLAALTAYLGGAPLFYWSSRPQSPYLKHHARQALALFAMLFGVLFLFLAAVLSVSYIMVYHRAFFEAYHLEALMLTWVRRIFLCWFVFWIFGASLALFKSKNQMPLVWRIMPVDWVLHATSFALVALLLLSQMAMLMVLQSRNYAASGAADAKVVMLYDDVNRYPAWIFYLGFYRVALAAHQRWGQGAIAIEKISTAKITSTISNAQILFIGTHGQALGILVDGKYIKPTSIKAPKSGRPLQYVYLTGCDSGAQRKAWEEAFYPAQVVSFDRLTALLEHVWWLWIEAPNVIRKLEESPKMPAPDKKGKKNKHHKKKELNKGAGLWQNVSPV